MADETDDDLPDELPEVAPDVPHCGMDDDEVERTEFQYSTRGPNDYIVSRPTDLFGGPEHAERWASLR